MTCNVRVYGFGSAFADAAIANDVDLLVIHPVTDAASCEFAIQCKHHLAKHIARVHVTVLSASEEADFHFIKMAGAIGLGAVRKSHLKSTHSA